MGIKNGDKPSISELLIVMVLLPEMLNVQTIFLLPSVSSYTNIEFTKMSMTRVWYSTSFMSPFLNDSSQNIILSFVRNGFFISSLLICLSRMALSCSSSSSRSFVLDIFEKTYKEAVWWIEFCLQKKILKIG